MRDFLNETHAVVAIAPVVLTDNTASVSNIIDLQGYDGCTFLFATGTLADADATFAVTIQDGDASNLSDAAAVSSTSLVGGTTLASFQFDSDNQTRKLGYVGGKRYVRVTVTPTANSGNAPIAALAVLEGANVQPVSNP